MSKIASRTEVDAPQASLSASPPRFGSPGSDFRWLLPILLCTGVLALALLVVVFIPMRRSVTAEPDLVISAVMADSLFLLQIRVWMILITAVLLGGAMAVAGARQNARALVRLELRLRRIADGETELPPTVPAKDFAQFDEVFACLRSGIERAARRHHLTLQQAQQSLRSLSQKLAAGSATPDEVRKTVTAVLSELENALDADRRAAAKQRI